MYKDHVVLNFSWLQTVTNVSWMQMSQGYKAQEHKYHTGTKGFFGSQTSLTR